MSNPTITMCPTMANPEAFHTVPELRQELHRANENLLKLTDQLHSLSCVTQDISEVLANILIAHMAGKADAVKELLDKIAARHVKVVPPTPGGLH